MISARFRALTANSKVIKTDQIVRGAMAVQNRWAQQAIRKLKVYPSQPAGSEYTRTGRLGDSWRQSGPTNSSSGIATRISNNARDERGRSYSEYVQGEQQTAVHAGRWTKLEDVLDRDGYIKELQQVIREAVT